MKQGKKSERNGYNFQTRPNKSLFCQQHNNITATEQHQCYCGATVNVGDIHTCLMGIGRMRQDQSRTHSERIPNGGRKYMITE